MNNNYKDNIEKIRDKRKYYTVYWQVSEWITI